MKLKQLREALDDNYFDTTTTGMPTPDDILFKDPDYHRRAKGKEGNIEWMSPDEYIQRSTVGFKSTGSHGAIESGRDPELVKKYAKMMQDGTKFHLPTLDYRDGDFSQEGLHRAMAARSLGATKMPVAILKDVDK